jgi:hypothetical protein
MFRPGWGDLEIENGPFATSDGKVYFHPHRCRIRFIRECADDQAVSTDGTAL